MVDANFNKEKGRQVVLKCKYLKHSHEAELIKLLIMLKTPTEVRKKQEFVAQSRSDHRLISSRCNIYLECFFQARVEIAVFFPPLHDNNCRMKVMGSWSLPMGQKFIIISLFIASMLMYLISHNEMRWKENRNCDKNNLVFQESLYFQRIVVSQESWTSLPLSQSENVSDGWKRKYTVNILWLTRYLVHKGKILV